MGIIGGLDVHRSQITYDWIDPDSGQRQRGQLAPAHREHLRVWLGRFAGQEATLALEGCTGWRYVVEELRRAGITAHLAEPADTSAARGPKRRAKTDQADARHLRELLEAGRLPQSWIPPAHVLEVRTLVGCYKALADEHTAWRQRIHATLFHHGVPAQPNLLAPDRRERLERGSPAVAGRPPAGHGCAGYPGRPGRRAGPAGGRAGRRRPPPAGRPGAGRPVRGRPPHRGRDLGRAGRGGPLHLLAAGGASHRPGRHRLLIRRQAHPRAAGPPGPAGAALGAVRGGQVRRPCRPPDHGDYLQVKGRLGGNRATLSVAGELVRRCSHTLGALGEQAYAPPSDSPDLGQVA
jgi:transposase